MHFFKKRNSLPITILILCTIAATIGGVFFYVSNTNRFQNFCDDLAYHMLENNPLELHYSIAHPEKMGFENISTNLIPFDAKYYGKSQIFWESCANTLSGVKTTFLNKETQFLYALLDKHIQAQLKNADFPYYENPLSCSSGVHSQLPILLSEYTFRNKDDIESYFLLLSQMPDYLNGLYEYAYAQELNGICIFKESLNNVRLQCLELFPEDMLKNQTHFLHISFEERLKDLITNGALTKEEAFSYVRRNAVLLQHKIAPAYKKLAKDLGNLKGSASLTGLSARPKGKAYYELLLQANSGSSRSVKEIQKMLYDRYDLLFEAYKQLLEKKTYLQNFNFPITSHKEMLQHLYKTSQTNFPLLSELDEGANQHVELKTVNGVLADMSAPAFYMTPPIDANDEHTIYINPASNMDTLDLYTTLAHEGFPGHLYQTVYSQTALCNANVPLIRQLLYYGGFTEGWAVYAELYAYQFAESICDTKTYDTLLLTRYNRELQLCICSILDIYIHYDGASLKDVQNLLSSLGLNSANAETIYSVICDAPANYPKYYVGYLEILSLKELAKNLWGKDFSDYAFHKWLLETGGGDFENLKELLQQ